MGISKFSLPRLIVLQFLCIALFCYIFINLAFFLVYTPLIPNTWWGPLAINGSEPPFLRWTIITLRFYLALLPFLITANVGLWWFMQGLHFDPPPQIKLLWGNLVGILLALPLLMQLPFYMAGLGFDPEFAPSGSRELSLPIFLWTVFIYLLFVSATTASHPLSFLRQLLLSPLFWLWFILFSFPAYLAFLAIAIGQLESTLIPLVAIPLTFLIPALLFGYSFPPYVRNHLLDQKRMQNSW
jgi:hypothetical protein